MKVAIPSLPVVKLPYDAPFTNNSTFSPLIGEPLPLVSDTLTVIGSLTLKSPVIESKVNSVSI